MKFINPARICSLFFLFLFLTLIPTQASQLFAQTPTVPTPSTVPAASTPSATPPATSTPAARPPTTQRPANQRPVKTYTSPTDLGPIDQPAPRPPGPPPKPAELLQQEPFDFFNRPSLIPQAAALAFLSLLPFIIMILTSFMKIVIVLSLLRTALGVQQSPPNQIINGVAFMLSIFVMYPTMLKMYDAAQKVVNNVNAPDSLITPQSASYILAIVGEAREPLRDFLKKNSSVKHQALFYRMAYRVLPEQNRPNLKPEDFLILVPSFITSQLKDAFEIGVLIYIPFFVVDLVTSNILLAMGMMMLSPVTISMPLKLFLLVMLDGWTLLVEGLVQTFR